MKKLVTVQKTDMKVMRVIPDRTADNKESHVFASSMHDLHRSWMKRIHIGLNGVDYVVKPRFWYIVSFTHDDIAIYLATERGEHSVYMEQRLNRLWPKATFEDQVFDAFPIENTDVSAIRYRRHNIFALSCDWRKDTIPIASVMSVIRDMRKGDRCMLAYCFEPYDRNSWSDRSDRAHADFRRGKTPRRSNIGAHFRPLEMLKSLDDALVDIHATVTAGIDGKEEAKKKDRDRLKRPAADAEKRQILSDGNMHPSTVRKPNQPTFKTWIRALVHSDDTARRRVLMRTLTNSFAELSGDNELTARPALVSAVNEINDLELSARTLLGMDVNIMSAEEIGKLIQVPTASIQDEYKEVFQSVNKREVKLPKWLTDGGIPLGEVTVKGKTSTVYIQTKNHDTFCMPHFAFGQMRVGKSLGFGVGSAVGAVKEGFSSFIIDVADGEFVDNARDCMPDWMPDDHIIDLDLGNPKYAIPMNWSELSTYRQGDEENSSEAGNQLGSQLVRFVDILAKAETTDRMGMYLKDAAKARLARPDATILDAMLMLTSKKYWNTHKRYVDSARLKQKMDSFWALSDTERQNIVRPIQTRMSLLMDDEHMSAHTMQPNKLDDNGRPLVDFRRWADGDTFPYFVGIRIPKDYFLDTGIDAMATFVISKLWLSILSRNDTPKPQRKPCIMVMDEPHQFPGAQPLYRDMVRESAKWRLKLVWLGHTLEDFKDNIDVIRSAGCQYSQYKSKSESSLRLVMPEMVPFTKEEVFAIPDKHWSINRLNSPNAGEPAPAFLAHMAPPPEKVKDRSYLREHFAQMLGRPRKEVLKSILEREAQYL